jgi:hypothetical protein
MGDMSDQTHIGIENYKVLHRLITQGPLKIELQIKDSVVQADIELNGKNQNSEIKLEKEFLLDGPSLDIFVSHLDLTVGKVYFINVFNAQSLHLNLFRFEVLQEDQILQYECVKCALKALDGPDKTETLWIYNSEKPVLIKKTAVLPEMGGAQLSMLLKETGI